MSLICDLRQYLIGADALKLEPENISVAMRSGTVTNHRATTGSGENRHFRQAYEIEVLITSYAGNPEDLFFLVGVWIHDRLPHCAEDVLSFEADQLDETAADVLLTIKDVNESVVVSEQVGGLLVQPKRDTELMPVVAPRLIELIEDNP